MIYQPQKLIYETLCLINAKIIRGSQSVFSDLPTITFSISNNRTELNLDNEIARQDIDIQIDIWTETTSEGSKLLEEVEDKLRNIGYSLTSSMDVPNLDSALQHISCHFETVR